MTASVHVVAGLDPSHGGPAYSVPALVDALNRREAPASLVTTLVPGESDPVERLRPLRVEAFPILGAGVPILGALRHARGLSEAVSRRLAPRGPVGIVHVHGLWQEPARQAAAAARAAGVPLVISPRGMLNPPALAYSRTKKRAMFALREARLLEGAALFHATSEDELEDVRRCGLTQPVAVIPNGVELPDPEDGPSPREPERSEPVRTILSLGRIHPKKGLDRLVRAWAAVEGDAPGWRLSIVGPAEGGHDRELAALAETLGVRRMTIDGPIYGEAKSAAYRDATLFVLATRSENFGITVAEALAHEVPVIVTHGAPWSAVNRERCGWHVPPDRLEATLREAIGQTDGARREAGRRGRAYVARTFAWDAIGEAMAACYRSIAQGAPPPAALRAGEAGRPRARWPL